MPDWDIRPRADMMDKQGFDLSQGIWRDSGWQEVEELRKKLETLKVWAPNSCPLTVKTPDEVLAAT